MSKELLTAILEACNEFNTFLTVDLQGESLATATEQRRQQLILSISDITTRIQSSHVSVRPRLYTPSANGGPAPPALGKKPAPKPPAPTLQEGQELYIECEGGEQMPEDYLSFTSKNGADDPQEMYEAMENADQPLDLYEEPVQGVISPPSRASLSPYPPRPQGDEPQELYEEPVVSPPPPPGGHTPGGPTPENSGSGAVYARTVISPAATGHETATEWMYDTTKTDDKKIKASQLDNISCKGNLEKLGGKSKKTWQVRFCVLSGPFMYFYEKESSKTYRNRIALPMYTIGEAPEYTNAKKRHFAFKLTHTTTSGAKKDYFFRSSKKESWETWVQAVREVNERTIVSPQMAPGGGGAGGAGGPREADVQQELYEPIDTIEEMTMSDEGESQDDLDDYVDVVPSPVDQDQEEYVDVDPSQDLIQEEYEEPSQFLSPPPPAATPPPRASKTPPPSHRRVDPPVDTTKIYTPPPTNGINLENVYVALWDFSASKRDELSIQRGDLVHIVDPDPSAEWWAGEGLDPNAASKTGSYGFLPSNYFMPAFEQVS